MKITKITQRRHFKKIAAGALATVTVGTMLVLPEKATRCHVPSAALSDYQAKFGSTVNVTFVAAD